MEEILSKAFMHAGLVSEMRIDWETEDLCNVDVVFMPWSTVILEDITADLIKSGMIVEDTHLYLRLPRVVPDVRMRLTIDLCDRHWRRDLVKHIGLVIANELKGAVTSDAKYSS